MKNPLAMPDLKQRLAAEAARLLCNGDTHDFQQAKLKAAARVCPGIRAPMPDNRLVEAEIRRYRQLFADASREQTRIKLLQAARNAMQFLQPFQPRLIGSIVQDTAGSDSPIDLLAHSDTPGEIPMFLDSHQIQYRNDNRMLCFSNDADCMLPVYRFLAGEQVIQITEIPARLRHHRIVSGNLRQRVESWNLHRLEQALNSTDSF